MAKRKSRRGRGKKPDRLGNLRKKIEQGPFKDYELVEPPAGVEKMSVVLRKFIKPYIEYTDSEHSYQALVGIGALSWNLALIPEGERNILMSNFIDEEFSMESRGVQSEMKEIIKQLIARKLNYFPKDKRKIVDYQITDLGDEYQVAVASVWEGDDLPEEFRTENPTKHPKEDKSP